MREKLIHAIKKLAVETGSLACLGCTYAENCNMHGCAILRKAVHFLETSDPEPSDGGSPAEAIRALQNEIASARNALCQMCKARGAEQHIICACVSCK